MKGTLGLFLGAILAASHAAIGFPLSAQETAAPPKEDTTPAVAPPEETVTSKKIEAKIKEIAATKDLDPALKADILETYRQAQGKLEEAQKNDAGAAAYRSALETAPAVAKQIRDELQRMAENPAEAPDLDIPAQASAKDLDQVLNKAQAELATRGQKFEGLESQLKEVESRPNSARQELADAKTDRGKVEKDRKAERQEGKGQALDDAHRVFLEARRQALSSRIDMLEQELLSQDARLDLLGAQRDQTAREIARNEARLKLLGEQVNKRRREEAEEARADAERAEREAAGKHPAVMALAARNAEMSKELTELAALIERTGQVREGTGNRLKQIEEELQSAQEKLDVVGLDEVLGQMLREQRRKLPDLHRFHHGSVERKARIAKAGLQQFRLEEERRQLNDLNKARESIMAAPVDGSLPPQSRSEIEAEADKLLADQRNLLDKLIRDYTRYRNDLLALDLERKGLVDKAKVFAAFLDEHLLWIPSAPTVGLQTLRGLAEALAWFLDGASWKAVGKILLDDVIVSPVPAALACLAFGALLLGRRRVEKQLQHIHARVGKVLVDSFRLTVLALLLTLLLAATWPLPLAFIAWRLSTSTSESEFPKGIGAGLAWVAILFLTMQSLRLLSSREGVSEVHFHWRPRTSLLLRRHLVWLMAVALPAGFITAVTEWYGNEAHQQTLGWLAFTVGMVALAVFTLLVLRPRGGIAEQVLADNPHGWLARLRYVWYPLAVGLPLSLAGLGAAGYYYSALLLERRLLATFWLTVGALLVHDMVIRWLLVAHGKLALKLAREKREAALKAREEAGAAAESGDEAPLPIEVPEMDLHVISDQARHLLRTLLGFSFAAGLWLVWAGVLPALATLNVEIWQNTVQTGNGPVHESITLSTLALAAVVVVITAAAARNIPGVLEIGLLQRLSIDAGSRYAITTLSRYAIVAVGIATTADLIGISWAKVQWLIAALGVGLGFGLQEIFANFVSGLIILFERPIRVGDTVTVGDVSGIVSRIRIRATTIIDWDRKELIVPNKAFITDRLMNWTLSDPITRIVIKLGIAYGSDTALAERLMLETAKANPLVLAEPEPRVFFMSFGESSLHFELRLFVSDSTNTSRSRAIHEIHTTIDRAFRQHGITIPFPQLDLHVSSGEPEIQDRDSAQFFHDST